MPACLENNLGNVPADTSWQREEGRGAEQPIMARTVVFYREQNEAGTFMWKK